MVDTFARSLPHDFVPAASYMAMTRARDGVHHAPTIIQESSDVATEAEVHAGLAEMFHDRSGNDTVDLTPTVSVELGAGRGSVKRVTIIGVGLQSNGVERPRHVGDLAEPAQARAA